MQQSLENSFKRKECEGGSRSNEKNKKISTMLSLKFIKYQWKSIKFFPFFLEIKIYIYQSSWS
jgi:hypothetical protein